MGCRDDGRATLELPLPVQAKHSGDSVLRGATA
jgi:hypothetical protein